MKILHLGKFYPLNGGMEKVILDIVEDFSSRNIVCDLLCVAVGKPHSVDLNKYAHIWATKSVFHAKSVSVSPSMVSILRKICHQYDIIHIHCPNPMATLALYLSGYRGKVVLHWHSDILNQKILLKLYAPLQSWLIRRADIIIGTTPVYLKESPFLQKVKSKLQTIPLGVDRIYPDQQKVQMLRERYKDKKIIFALGRMVPYKGFRYLIDAASFLDDRYVILIGGTGPLQQELSQQIVDKGLQDKVIMLGFIHEEELANYYGACDVFCLSSIWKTEAFGLVQIEAMSCATPVVATTIKGSGVAWVNEDHYSGLNVEPENPKELARAILEITKSEEKYQQYAKQAQKRYQDCFTKENMLKQYDKMYRGLLHI